MHEAVEQQAASCSFIYRLVIKKTVIGKISKLALKLLLQVGLIVLVLLFVWAFQSRKMPPLQVWHTAILESEFTAGDATPQFNLQDYLNLEKQLFDELRVKVYDRVEPTPEMTFSRYRAGSMQDPDWPQRNWNRTFELVPDRILGGALLLHGLTDSPYSLRRIGEILYDRGYYVLGLRLPGHGTIPGALTRVHWEDWVAASQLGARHVRERIGSGLPFVIAGYSNGGGLAVKYALDTLDNPDLPVPDRLLLFSPEIAINPLARIADITKLLSFMPYFAQFKWQSIEPEYDPFKYNSFAMNAAHEAWEVTAAIERQIRKVHDSGRITELPPILTFLSWTDATVETSATIQRLYDRLETPGSELVIFDVNRLARIAFFIPAANVSPLKKLEARDDLPYRLTVISNGGENSARVTQRLKEPHSDVIAVTPLPMFWPQSIYSLAHVAIPFGPDDPVYGNGSGAGEDYNGIPLGALQPRGETDLLVTPLSRLMRLRYNPFFAYIEDRVLMEIDKTTEQTNKGDL